MASSMFQQSSMSSFVAVVVWLDLSSLPCFSLFSNFYLSWFIFHFIRLPRHGLLNILFVFSVMVCLLFSPFNSVMICLLFSSSSPSCCVCYSLTCHRLLCDGLFFCSPRMDKKTASIEICKGVRPEKIAGEMKFNIEEWSSTLKFQVQCRRFKVHYWIILQSFNLPTQSPLFEPFYLSMLQPNVNHSKPLNVTIFQSF